MSRGARRELLGGAPDADLAFPERDVDLGRLDEIAADEQAQRGAVNDAEHDAASLAAQHKRRGDAQLAWEGTSVAEPIDLVLWPLEDLVGKSHP
eukprot:4603943-Pyramimonas_sp.AAC.1